MIDAPGRIARFNLHSTRRISGLTHSYYRYPATTSPELVRDIISNYSAPGDHVLDPFMGGGTTVVEALAAGRIATGIDINELAVLITRVKTTPLSENDWTMLGRWASGGRLFSLRPPEQTDPRTTNLPGPLRDAFCSARRRIAQLPVRVQRNAATCALLRTGQWALESRDEVPDTGAIREKLRQCIASMRDGMDELLAEVRGEGITKSQIVGRRLLLHGNSRDEDLRERLGDSRGRFQLVVTSPPYPGVHVLYHRWQVKSRRETPAPYWIANRRDGFGPSYYTLGGRSQAGQLTYFDRLEKTFRSIRPLLRRDATVAQIVAFTDARTQLPRFLEAMNGAGYSESDVLTSGVSELVRKVPNRRWYARGRNNDAGREFLLLHSVIRA